MSPSKTKSCHFRKPPAAKAGMNLVWLNVSQIYTIDENSTRTACSLSSQYIPSLLIDPSHGVYVIQPFFFSVVVIQTIPFINHAQNDVPGFPR